MINIQKHKRTWMGLSMVLALSACQTTNRMQEPDISEPVAKPFDTVKQSPTREKNPGPMQPENGKHTTRLSSAHSGNREANAITSFNLSGAIAARSKSKSWTASINWAQQGQSSYQIRLMGPIGAGTVLIQKQGGVISYKEGSKKATAANADQLLYSQTGIRLPVSNLYYWVRGLPAPGSIKSAKRDAANHLVSLQQAGYVIEFGGYSAQAKAALPTQIRLQGQGVGIKLIIKHWQA